eukprot:1337306-Amphidinium_carterae.2
MLWLRTVFVPKCARESPLAVRSSRVPAVVVSTGTSFKCFMPQRVTTCHCGTTVQHHIQFVLLVSIC